MFELILIVFILPISLILNFFLLRRSLRILKVNEDLNNEIEQIEIQREETLQKLEDLLQQMRDYDLRGAFEADDEVGGAYKEIINLIETYKNEI